MAKKIKVLMMGGRRCGKSTVLAGVSDCCINALNNVDMNVVCVEGGAALADKMGEAESYFTDAAMRKGFFVPDREPSRVQNEYKYEIDINGKGFPYYLEFQDFPGEWLSNPEQYPDAPKTLEKWFQESQVIIIAIDTPCLVENYDEYEGGFDKKHTEHNRVNEITEFFKTAFAKSKYNKMVIFVPVKCEKYYYENRLDEVNELVQKGYEDLFGFFAKPDVKEVCSVAISPILSFGGAEFFEFDSESYVGTYTYRLKAEEREYKPLGCELPLFIVLKYLVNIAEKRLQNRGLFRWLVDIFSNKADLQSVLDCKKQIEQILEANTELPVTYIQ
ncbi:MAG: hypothetical protein IJD40_11410 [Lachnospiraceae bacterium]|nr:hypothetical protein [Lachnospiraceae bacterium]